MSIRVERDTLAEAVTWTARSLPARPPVPVLAGLLIEASGDHLTLSSFDYEVSGRVAVDAVVEEAGTVLVSGRLLAEITRALPARPVTLTTEGSKVQLVCGSATFSLPTLPVEEYPSLPDMPVQTGALAGARVRRGRRPGGRRRRPRRHAAGAHRHPPGDRGRHPHPRGDRPLPPRRARDPLEPRVTGLRRLSRWSRPGRWPTRPSRSAAATACRWRWPRGRSARG